MYVDTGLAIMALAPEALELNENLIDAYNTAPWHGICGACPDRLYYAKDEDDLNEELLEHFIEKHRHTRNMTEAEK